MPGDMDALAQELASRHTAVGRSRLARLDGAYRALAAAAALPDQARAYSGTMNWPSRLNMLCHANDYPCCWEVAA